MPIAVTLAVLLGLYVGAYYWMVFPHPFPPTGVRCLYYEGTDKARGGPVYATNPNWDRFFFPIHWLDRRIRPHVWEPTP